MLLFVILVLSSSSSLLQPSMPEVETLLHVPPTESLLSHNGSVFMHAYLTNSRGHAVEMHYQLNRFMPPPPPEKYKNLLESTSAEREEVERVKVGENEKRKIPFTDAHTHTLIQREHELKPWISHWKNNLTLALVGDQGPVSLTTLPPQVRPLLTLNDETHQYEPVFYVNDFWTYKDHFYPINASVTALPLSLLFQPMGPWKWHLTVQMEQSLHMQQSWGAIGSEMDEMKVTIHPLLVVALFVILFLFISE
jgi:hypothetical protein